MIGNGDWLRSERNEFGAERILDAAAELFAQKGVSAVVMGAVGRAAGCSRATMYRYFRNRQALHVAFIHRETRRVVQRVAARLPDSGDPATRIVDWMVAVIADVRSNPHLIAWFGRGEEGTVNELVHSSEVIEALVAEFLLDGSSTAINNDVRLRAQWLLRMVVSFLTIPAVDPNDERAMLELFALPALASSTSTQQ